MSENRIRASEIGFARRIAAVILLTITAASPSALAVQKMKPEDVVAKHLESIGAEETRASVSSRIINGTTTVTFRSPGKGQIGGQAVVASRKNQVLMGMNFGNPNYPYEKLGFDGETLTTGYITPGSRSALANFFLTYDIIFKQGLIGGVLSSAWPLHDLTAKNPRLEYGGIKKINNREAYELEYYPRGGSDLQIKLFFDKETFQHVRTEYERVISALMGSNPDTSARQRETRYKLVEEFSDFKRESGLMMPHTYKINLESNTSGGTYSADWTMSLTQFQFNQRIDPSSFNITNE
jgi:hypothetical protein